MLFIYKICEYVIRKRKKRLRHIFMKYLLIQLRGVYLLRLLWNICIIFLQHFHKSMWVFLPHNNLLVVSHHQVIHPSQTDRICLSSGFHLQVLLRSTASAAGPVLVANWRNSRCNDIRTGDLMVPLPKGIIWTQLQGFIFIVLLYETFRYQRNEIMWNYN